MHEENRQKALEIIEKAKAQKGLVTVLMCRLEQYDTFIANMLLAEASKDPQWHWFTRLAAWNDQRTSTRRNRRYGKAIKKRRDQTTNP